MPCCGEGTACQVPLAAGVAVADGPYQEIAEGGVLGKAPHGGGSAPPPPPHEATVRELMRLHSVLQTRSKDVLDTRWAPFWGQGASSYFCLTLTELPAQAVLHQS